MCMCMSVCRYSRRPGEGTGFHRARVTSDSEPLIGVLGTELVCSAEAGHALNHCATSPGPLNTFNY